MGTVRAFAPGRTELAGNHTDHQGGRVIAASLDCGTEVVLTPQATTRAHVESEGFAAFEMDIRDAVPQAEERQTTQGLVRGVVSGLRAAGVDVTGFDARITSTVPSGGGLSSSAAFELALACALITAADSSGQVQGAVHLARIGQAAEQEFFGKPCGLMDQLAIACGGINLFDFADEAAPTVQPIGFDFACAGLALCLIDTHCDHSAYTHEYAQVALDMFDVARFLGAPTLSKAGEGELMRNFEAVRDTLGDAPALRALHYYHENRLVDMRARALQAGDVHAFLEATNRSGASSAQYLQNVSTSDRVSQPAMVALALADSLLAGEGACRIHGGGFGGTVQAFVPIARAQAFQQEIDGHLGAGSCKFYEVSKEGAKAQWA